MTEEILIDMEDSDYQFSSSTEGGELRGIKKKKKPFVKNVKHL